MATMTQPQASEIQARFEAGVLHLAGVNGIDVGQRQIDGQYTDELVLRVYVASVAAAPALPATFEGMKVEVIERSFKLQRP